MLLGAIVAGGGARRFGSDKALAVLAGKPLWRHVADALVAGGVADLVACGRPLGDLAWLPDRPMPDLGPLGGIAAALAHAAAYGHAGVVTAPCDAPVLPAGIVAALVGEGAAYAADCPVVGWWPAALAGTIDAHLARGGDRSMRGWIATAGARRVDVGAIANVNRPGDLAALDRVSRSA